eukprot:SAG31_NODE_45557_length_258_cov_0.899371_1_plen_85_part_11
MLRALVAGLLVAMAVVQVTGDTDASVLNLDEHVEQDAAEQPLFTLPITVKGAQVECAYFDGQDPVDVAIEFGSPNPPPPPPTRPS